VPENKVKKYFKVIEAWAWCPICEDMISLIIDKKEIINVLQEGIYTKEYKHSNPNPDLEDPDDLSGGEHTIYIYINENYDITGVKAFFGDSPTTEEIGAGTAQEGGEVSAGPERKARRHRGDPVPVRLSEDNPQASGRPGLLREGDQRGREPPRCDALRQGRRDAGRILEHRGRGAPPARGAAEDRPGRPPRRSRLRRAGAGRQRG